MARPNLTQIEQARWLHVIDEAILAAETAELELSREGASDPMQQRKNSGSYYTPADVASHFWDLFFRHHRIGDLGALITFLSTTDLVEPSAGSGIFVFSFLRKAALLGAMPEDLAAIRFHIVDVNLSALRFFSERLREIEKVTHTRFAGIGLSQQDFLRWVMTSNVANVVFVGNPPFITNPRGARWRNLYADFVEAILTYDSLKGVSLILPLSVCFSRDYVDLRRMILSAGMGVSASNYDNIPDCLFKVGKPDSTNTNRANSQRCTIINIGGPDSERREASALLYWSTAERGSVLSSFPRFHSFIGGDHSGQIPRPASKLLVNYMKNSRAARPLRAFLSKLGRPAFSIGGVARNFIGIRDFDAYKPGTIPIKGASEEDSWIVLQIVVSKLFYEYWRTYGDGFHVTVDLIERFPVTDELAARYRAHVARTREVWRDRAAYAKEKLNSGQVIRSYDFHLAFQGE